MKRTPNFELVNVADDYILVPLGDQMEKFNGTVVLNEVSAFLLEKLESDLTIKELVRLLLDEYDVDFDTAQADVEKAVEEMKKLGIVYE